jgi:hypothetical protein
MVVIETPKISSIRKGPPRVPAGYEWAALTVLPMSGQLALERIIPQTVVF